MEAELKEAQFKMLWFQLGVTRMSTSDSSDLAFWRHSHRGGIEDILDKEC